MGEVGELCDVVKTFVSDLLIVGDFELLELWTSLGKDLDLFISKVAIGVINFQGFEVHSFLVEVAIPPLVVDQVCAVKTETLELNHST